MFTLGGVSVRASGSSPAVSGPVSVSGSVVPVSPDAGVGASDSFWWCVGVCSVCACGVWWLRGVLWCCGGGRVRLGLLW